MRFSQRGAFRAPVHPPRSLHKGGGRGLPSARHPEGLSAGDLRLIGQTALETGGPFREHDDRICPDDPARKDRGIDPGWDRRAETGIRFHPAPG